MPKKLYHLIKKSEFGESADPHADVVALLGGLAMPKSIKQKKFHKILDVVL